MCVCVRVKVWIWTGDPKMPVVRKRSFIGDPELLWPLLGLGGSLRPKPTCKGMRTPDLLQNRRDEYSGWKCKIHFATPKNSCNDDSFTVLGMCFLVF